MQRYKQHLLNMYGEYEADGSYVREGLPMDRAGCIKTVEKLLQLPIQANDYGKYVGYHTTPRAYHADKLLFAHQLAVYATKWRKDKVHRAIGCCAYVRQTQFARLP